MKLIPDANFASSRAQKISGATTSGTRDAGTFFCTPNSKAFLGPDAQGVTKAVLLSTELGRPEGETVAEKVAEIKAIAWKEHRFPRDIADALPTNDIRVRGARHVTDAEVLQIRLERAAHETCDVLAARHGLTNSYISQIACGKVRREAGGPITRMRTRGMDLMTKVWLRVAKDNTEDGCWPWTGRLDKDGYGEVDGDGNTNHPVHKLILEEKLGRKLDPREVSRHRCHNRPCARPSHLNPGSIQENVNDMVEAGRSLVGEKSPSAVLTESDVFSVRSQMRMGRINYEATGRIYGVTGNTIKHAAIGKTWRHLPSPAVQS